MNNATPSRYRETHAVFSGPQNRLRRFFRAPAIASLFVVTVFGALKANAQSVPANCRPNSGANFECAVRFPTPYTFLAGTCGPNAFQRTESAAFAVYRTQFSNFECNISFQLEGWISPSAPKSSAGDFTIPCGGFPSTYPIMSWGRESTNWLLETVARDTVPAPTCGPPQQDVVYGAVRRERSFLCPEGYQTFSQDVCYKVSGTIDYAKNYGCPKEDDCSTKNPISIGTANKFLAQTDYLAAGNSLLSFTRYYNSVPVNRSGSGHYKSAAFTQPGVLGAYAGRSSEPSEHGGRYGIVGLGATGIGWRHTYQRSIVREVSSLLTGAYVFRPDGRVLTFTKMSGQWYAQADVNLRLHETTDGSGNQVGWQLITEQDTIESYDVAGRLSAISTRSGLTQTLSYDGCGRVAGVADSFGASMTFGYAQACGSTDPHRIASLTVAGGVYQYQYDADGRLTNVTYPDMSARQYHYENASFPAAVTGITDESLARYATYEYDNEGRAVASELAGGAERVGVSYPFSGFQAGSATLTTPLNGSVTYTFAVTQGKHKVTSQSAYCVDCPSNVKQQTYDVNGNVASKTDFLNRKSCYAHDLAQNLETHRVEGFAAGISCPANLATYTPTAGTRQRKISTQWHASYRLPTQIDEPGKRTTFTHDANGNVLTKTELDTATSESRTWTYTYNGFGHVLTADGPRTDVSDVTTYTYYACTTGFQCGRVETITNAAGHVTTYNTYNAHGQPLTITDPNGLVTTLTYDLRQRLTSRTVGSEQTTFDYWPTGLLKKATLPDGSFLEYTYDAAHRLTEIEDAEGNRIVYTLDAMGNRIEEEVFDPSSALSQTRTRVFNTLNQLWKEIGAAGTAAVTTTFGYDNNGNETNINAPLARNTVQAYDELNRLKQVTDPLSGVTLYGYNALDQLLSVTDPRAKVTTYSYNALGDLKQQVSPDTGTTVNTHDSGGNLATSTDARSKTGTYAYDALNRVTSLTYPDQTITYAYDTGTNQNGRLTQVTDASGSTAWSYDSHGRVLTKQQTMGSVSKSVGYAYDSFGRLQSLTLPSGNTITYGYTDGKVTSLTLNGSTTILSNVLYQPFGPTRGWTWGNSTLAIREFDTDGKITDIDSAGLKTYSYDDAFRITGITDASDPTLSQTYGHDLLDRLTSATGASFNQGWTYDANGNRLTQSGSQPSTYTVSSSNNRITSISGSLARTYGYDNAGNTTSDGTVTSTYNDAGRMVSATKASVTTTYALNALGQRVKKTTSGSSTYFVYDEAGHLTGEYDNSGNLIQETIWLHDTPVAVLKPNGGSGVIAFYVHTDHLNTPRRISRTTDNVVVWRWDLDPFGTTAVNEDPDGDTQLFAFKLRFPGQYLDSETGLHYNYFRDYDPQVGRYTQSDPIGLEGGTNTYAYVGGNPILFTDPFGLDRQTDGPAPGTGICPPLLAPFTPGTPQYDELVRAGTEFLDDLQNNLPKPFWAKGGKQNERDSGLSGLSDDEISRRARDPNRSGEERRRYQKEEKARGIRNKRKRR